MSRTSRSGEMQNVQGSIGVMLLQIEQFVVQPETRDLVEGGEGLVGAVQQARDFRTGPEQALLGWLPQRPPISS